MDVRNFEPYCFCRGNSDLPPLRYIDVIYVFIYSESCCGGGTKQQFSVFHSLFKDLWGSLGEKTMNIFFYDREKIYCLFFEIGCLLILLSSVLSLPKGQMLFLLLKYNRLSCWMALGKTLISEGGNFGSLLSASVGVVLQRHQGGICCQPAFIDLL